MIVLATVATVIASQAVISGAFSMTKQAIQLGFLPSMNVVHTSEREMGQIFVPAINWMLLAAVVASVLGFGSSTALGSAYGIAVTGTMLITTILTFFVIRYAWQLNWWLCIAATGFFFVIDAAFFSANLLKFVQGGWFPLLIGAVVFTLMSTWKRGVELIMNEAHSRAGSLPLHKFVETLIAEDLVRIGGTAVFVALDADAAPRALVSNVEHNKVLHERVLFVKLASREIPYVPLTERVTVEPIESNCYKVLVAYGFKDEINLPEALRSCATDDVAIDPLKVSYFLSRIIVVASPGKGMWLWQSRLFANMTKNIGNLATYLRLPASRVVELGSEVEI